MVKGSLTRPYSCSRSRIRAPSPKNVTPPTQSSSSAVSIAEVSIGTSRAKDTTMKTRFRSKPIQPHAKNSDLNRSFMIPHHQLAVSSDVGCSLRKGSPHQRHDFSLTLPTEGIRDSEV